MQGKAADFPMKHVAGLGCSHWKNKDSRAAVPAFAKTIT
jgi:hypothetical protein